jgi:hypothetical protein
LPALVGVIVSEAVDPSTICVTNLVFSGSKLFTRLSSSLALNDVCVTLSLDPLLVRKLLKRVGYFVDPL